jgi:ketosteroid isomerase-like protein
MRIIICLFLFVMGLVSVPNGQKAAGPELKSLVETERAFARMAEEKGTRASFMEFIADDGILYRPGPVNGKKWMQDHPVPPSATRNLLSWQPIFAEVSAAGDLGYTTGPWEYKDKITDAKPSAFGNFMTVWKKQPNGVWRFVLDMGISNPEPTQPIPAWEPPQSVVRRAQKIEVASPAADLMMRELEFSDNSRKDGAQKAFGQHAAGDVRLFREGKFPFVGRDAAAKELRTVTAQWTWHPVFADVSTSGDLGYTYGTYELREKGLKSVTEKGNYTRVWKKEKGQWRVVVDVTNALSSEKESN